MKNMLLICFLFFFVFIPCSISATDFDIVRYMFEDNVVYSGILTEPQSGYVLTIAPGNIRFDHPTRPLFISTGQGGLVGTGQKFGLGADGHMSIQVGPTSTTVFQAQASTFEVGIGPLNMSPSATLHIYDATSGSGDTTFKIQEGDLQNSESILVVANDGTTKRLELDGSTLKLHGRVCGKRGDNVASANDITLGDGNLFLITGTTEIQRISGIDWSAGSQVMLQFDGTVQVTNGVAASNDYYGLKLSNGGNFYATSNDMIGLIFDGTWWREISRTTI